MPDLAYEFKVALTQVSHSDPRTASSSIARLRTLDLKSELPAQEYQCLELVVACRLGDRQRGSELASQLMAAGVSRDYLRETLSSVPEYANAGYRQFVESLTAAPVPPMPPPAVIVAPKRTPLANSVVITWIISVTAFLCFMAFVGLVLFLVM